MLRSWVREKSKYTTGLYGKGFAICVAKGKFTPLTHLPWPRVLPVSNSLVWLKSHHCRGQGVGALGCRYGPEPQALEKYMWKL
jgi:hypothetical protein